MLASDSPVPGFVTKARRLLNGFSRLGGVLPADREDNPAPAGKVSDEATASEKDPLTFKFRAILLFVSATLVSGSIIVGIGALQASGDYLSARLNAAFSVMTLCLTLLIYLEIRKIGLRNLARTLEARPDEETGQIYARFLIGFFCLSYIVAKGLTDGVGARGVQASIAVVGFLCSYGALLFWWMIKRPGISHKRRCTAVIFDLMSTTVALHLGGEYSAPFFGVFLWVILGNGFRYGITYLIFAAVVGTIGFGAVMGLTPFWRSSPGLGFGLLATLIIIPIYVGSLIKQLHAATAEAEAASKAKSRFLAAMSHELRTPLNAIIGMSDLLAGTKIDGDQRSMTRGVKSAANTLLALINNILDISKFEAGNMVPTPAPVNIYQLIAELDHMFALQAQANGIEFQVVLEPDVPPWIETDADYLRDAVINLIGNSLKFTKSGHVRVTVGLDGPATDRMVALRVSDTGIGIAEHQLNKIFGTFTQADDSVTRKFGGSGLGLSIVRQIARSLGGEVTVSSELGAGSTFVLTFPYVVPKTEQPLPAPDGDLQLVVVTGKSREQYAPELGEWAARLVDTRVKSIDQLQQLLKRRSASAPPLLALIDARGAGSVATYLQRQPGDTDVETCQSSASFASLLMTDATGADAEGMAARLPSNLRCLATVGAPALTNTTSDSPTGTQQNMDNALRFAGRVLSAGAGSDDDAASKKSRRSLDILVAEDNTVNRRVVGRILSNAGHRPTLVPDGMTALEALEDKRFDIVLMDFNMPEMTGAEVVKLYRFADPSDTRTPFVAFTADGTQESRQRCEAAGMVGMIVKPLEAVRLLDEIDRYAAPPLDDMVAAETATAADAEQALDRATDSAWEPSEDFFEQQVKAFNPAGDDDASMGDNVVAHPRRPDKTKVVDDAAIDQLRLISDDSAFFRSLVLDFLEDTKETLARLKEGVDQGDPEIVRDQAHAMRSSASHFGAQQLFDLCLSVSQINKEDLDLKGQRFLNDVEAACKRIEDRLIEILNQPDAATAATAT